MAGKIGVYGISTGSLIMARRIASLGKGVAVCGLPGDARRGSAGAGSEVEEAEDLAALKLRLGSGARIFSFSRYDGFPDSSDALLGALEPGDSVFEANAFPSPELEKTQKAFARAGIAWVPVKAAICAERGEGKISIVAGSEGLDEEGRALLSSVASLRLDGRSCYAELPDARQLAAARASYRSLLDVMFQGYADAYRVLAGLLKMSPFEARMVFSDWGKTELDSPVLHGMRDILGTMDESGEAALDMVLDAIKLDSGDIDSLALSLSLGTPPPLASAAFAARAVSAQRDERLGASVALSGPKSFMPLGKEFAAELRDGLIASFALAVSQSLACLQGCAGGDKALAGVATAWAGASLIQGPLMDKAAGMLTAQESSRSLLLEPEFLRILNRCQNGLRKTVAASVEAGIAAPVLSSALSIYDSLRSEKLSSNFVAAGLDYFFGVGFERVDRPRRERYHRDWSGDGSVKRLS